MANDSSNLNILKLCFELKKYKYHNFFNYDFFLNVDGGLSSFFFPHQIILLKEFLAQYFIDLIFWC